VPEGRRRLIDALQIPCWEDVCRSEFAFPADFIYKMLRAPTRIEADATPTFALLPGIFLGAKVFQRSADAVSIIAISVHPVVGFDNL
jgi:hypothetical protein